MMSTNTPCAEDSYVQWISVNYARLHEAIMQHKLSSIHAYIVVVHCCCCCSSFSQPLINSRVLQDRWARQWRVIMYRACLQVSSVRSSCWQPYRPVGHKLKIEGARVGAATATRHTS
jgi:hypothetical protein